jgi:hypothetical protein
VLHVVDELAAVVLEQRLELGDADIDVVGGAAERDVDRLEDLVANPGPSRERTLLLNLESTSSSTD